MRHFLALALTPLLLAPCMMQPAAKARLIAPTRTAHALAPCLLSTWFAAIPLSVIAAPADSLLALTTRAIEHSVAGDDRNGSSLPKAGQLLPTASLSLMGQALSDDRRRLPEGSRTQPSGLHLLHSPAVLPRPQCACTRAPSSRSK